MSFTEESDVTTAVDMDTVLLTLRKPTELKKVIDSIPKPAKAVPRNGLPIWYRLGLECKLPVPKIPEGKIVFSRGKVGEDVRRVELCGERPNFDLTDPYCYNVSYEYIATHDPHLAFFFQQRPARNWMKKLGYVTKDGRAICSLKEFNQYRKYLYNRFMDRIHMEIIKLDEQARDNLMLQRVERDVARRAIVFRKAERAREHIEKVAKGYSDEISEKKRKAREREKKLNERIRLLNEYNERIRKERIEKALVKENRIKQRVKAAYELETRRKIMMLRQWKTGEKKRLQKARQEEMARKNRRAEEANTKWMARIQNQNNKIQEETLLLRIYSEDMSAAAARRIKQAEIQAYTAELELARIRLANYRLMHGGKAKQVRLIKKMGNEFEKSKRGTKGMSMEMAQSLAEEYVDTAHSTEGDALTNLGQARIMMDTVIVLPSPPIKILMEALQSAIMEFARRRVIVLLQAVEEEVRVKAAVVFFQNIRPEPPKRRSKQPRWSTQVASVFSGQQSKSDTRQNAIGYGEIETIAPEEYADHDMKPAKYRTPTPMPSKMRLAEVTFSDRLEDLPDPIALPTNMLERKKLLEMVNAAGKLLKRSVKVRVIKGLDVPTGKVTLPVMRHAVEWGEIVEGMSDAVVNHRVNIESPEIRRTSEFVAIRVLKSLLAEMKEEKRRRKFKNYIAEEDEEKQDFYVPDQVMDPVPDENAAAVPIEPPSGPA